MTQASFDAPTSDDGSNIDSKRSGRYKYDVRTQMLGLYKTDTESPNATPQPASDGTEEPAPRTLRYPLNPLVPTDESPAAPALSAPKANPVRFLWPATLPLPGQESERPSFAPGVQQARDAAWPGVLRLGGQVAPNDSETREQRSRLGQLLPSVSMGRALIAFAGTAFAIGLAFFFAYALRASENDYYVPTQSELPQSVPAKSVPAPAHTTPKPTPEPARHSDEHEPTVAPVPKNPEPLEAPSEAKPAAHAENSATPQGRAATREAAFRSPARGHSGAQSKRVPWWE